MKAVILAGGFGTRISEESRLMPKPMIKIGNMPILWHIMKIYSSYGIKDFIICGGYKQDIIKDYFANYPMYKNDTVFNLKDRTMHHEDLSEDWNVTIADTGHNTMTGGRIKRIEKYLENDEEFCLTYGDGVSDVPIDRLIEFHRARKKTATLTAVHPEPRFGFIDFDGDDIAEFREKDSMEDIWVNGGFMVLDRSIMDYIDNDETVFEKDSLPKLASERQLNAFRWPGFWQCMDTMRDKEKLNRIWDSGNIPWKKW